MAKSYPKLAANLRRLLFERNMKATDLSRALKVPQPTIHRLVTGKCTRPHASSLDPLVKYFELTPQQLTGEEPLPDLDSKNKKQLSTNNIKVIPIIEWDKSHDLTTATDNKTGEIATVGNISDECFALTMNDFSMEPLFPKHTILIFDPLKNAVDRSYILVKLDGKETPIFRQILIDVDHKYLKPLNPDLNIYKMRLLSEKDQILGCLFESRINHAIDDTIEEKIK